MPAPAGVCESSQHLRCATARHGRAFARTFKWRICSAWHAEQIRHLKVLTPMRSGSAAPVGARQPDRRDDRPREVEWTCSQTRQNQALSPCMRRERTSARCLAARSRDAREFLWPVCASQLSCAHASSGDVVWQVEIDSSCGTDGAVSMRGWCAGDAGRCL